MKATEIKPGTILILKRKAFDPIGTINSVIEGDSSGVHACVMLPNGKIGTTGADQLILYGEVDPTEYLKGKTAYLLETVDPLSASQLAIIQACHEEMLHSGWRRIYGFWKIPYMIGLEAVFGAVSKTGLKPKEGAPDCPICDQAVGYMFWKAGVPIGRSVGKLDYTALSPALMLKEAQDTTEMLKSCVIDNHAELCQMLKLVNSSGLSF